MQEDHEDKKEQDIDGDDELDSAFDDDGDLEDGASEGVDDDLADEEDADADSDSDGAQTASVEDEEADDEDPSDVEDDLGTILKERLVSEDEEEAEAESEVDDDDDQKVVQHNEAIAEDFVCNGCFLRVSASQFGSVGSMVCPNGEDPCPSIELLGG